MDGKVHFVYKRVAVVEQFFDIIYSVHVESAGDTQLRGRAGKHCGQKRTYRAVSSSWDHTCEPNDTLNSTDGCRQSPKRNVT